MENIISYLRNQQHTFNEFPFNAVDSLIASTISYFNFESVDFGDPRGPGTTRLHDILALAEKGKLIRGNWLEDSEQTDAFWIALMASRRYRDTFIGFYTNEMSPMVEKQFSATSLMLSNELIYLAFRGTDGSFAGWKEDFNLCFKHVIPSQVSAARYLSGVASASDHNLILGGHSKGGNLAEYAALVADDSVYQRISAIYNHDGPSFLDDPSPRINSEEYRTKLHKTVPESSAFGMILERRSDYRVVRSNANFVFQHEPFTWITDGDNFLYQDKLNSSALFLDASLDSWLTQRSAAERERFIDTIYELFASTKADNWPDFHEELLLNTRQILGASTKLDAETKKFLLKTVSSLATAIKDEAVKRFLPSPPHQLKLTRKDSYKN